MNAHDSLGGGGYENVKWWLDVLDWLSLGVTGVTWQPTLSDAVKLRLATDTQRKENELRALTNTEDEREQGWSRGGR